MQSTPGLPIPSGPAAGASLDRHHGRAVVRLTGAHDLTTVALLRSVLGEAAASPGHSVVVDVSRVAFLDASTLGAIVAFRQELRDSGRVLVVRSATDDTRRIFEICGLTDLLETTVRVDRVAPAVDPGVSPGASVGSERQ